MNNQQLLKNIINLEKKFESVNSFLINKGINIQQDNVSTTSDTLKKIQDEIKNIKNQDSTVELKAEIEKLKKQPALGQQLKTEVDNLKKQIPANTAQLNNLKSEIDNFKKQGNVTILRTEIENLKKQTPVNSNQQNEFKSELDKYKLQVQNLSNEINKLRDKSVNDSKDIELLKKNKTEIKDIDNIIKSNFDETNKKFEEVNKAVKSLDENLIKANEIEVTVKELKKKL